MSKDQPGTSFGDSNPQPPTPKQTPTLTVYPSPVFQTPNPNRPSNDSSGRTPRFAEDYSVFNSVPGDLRGGQRPFGDLEQDYTHQRVLSAEGLAIEIATHVNHFSPNPDLPLPPVDPAHRLASSPNSVNVPKEYSADTDSLLSPNSINRRQPSKKARRGTATESELTQTATPPPTDRRGKRKLTLSLNMQNDQSFAQPDFTGVSQQHELAALMAAQGDMFGYPMSAPAAAPANFWDPSMSMDLDFGAPQTNMFQSTPVSSHRHTGSFDWNNDIPLFQEPSAPRHSNQEGLMPTRHDRTLAPKPSMSNAPAGAVMSAGFVPQMEDPFGIMNPGDAVDPGLLFGRSQSMMDMSFNSMGASGSAESAIAESGSRSAMGGDLRRSASFQEVRNTTVPDRAFASSPVKSLARAGLNRSMSENRGKRAQAKARQSLPKLAPAPTPAPRPMSQASNGSTGESGRPLARPSGRSSPLKHQHRLSSLASIPESSPQPPPTWRSVRFTIDSRGRARAEATMVVGTSHGNISPRRTSRDSGRKEDWEASDDDSSTDDEPIIIPSRNNSFNASFALPDPRKPVGSIFHSSKRSSSERSLGSFSNEGPGSQHDGDSEAETVMNEAKDKVGDAASELRKLVEDRQKRSSQLGSARGQRFLQTNNNNLGNFRGDMISPSTLTESSHPTDRHEVRCVCHRNRADEGDGFMVQCESCELWLHGKCINMTRRTLPRVYICAFCANTPNMRGGRLRDTGRGTGTHGPVASPLANKSLRNFR